MGEKDMVEKIMEDYPDVFADILNVLLFDGKQVVQPEELFDVGLRSQFKADTGQEHEQERDVAKYWIRDGKILALFGLENQTNTDRDMPMRIFSYDGSSYKSQLMKTANDGQDDARYPIITLVLYFGEKRWGERGVSLKGMFGGPDELQKYMQNYCVYVFEIAHLSEEELKKFRSDFGFLAEFMVRKRKAEPFRITQDKEIAHVDEVLKMLSVFAEDEYVEKVSKALAKRQERGERIMGCNISKAWMDLGREEGIREGIEANSKEMNLFITYMLRDNRVEELKRSASDSTFQKKLFEEYGLSK